MTTERDLLDALWRQLARTVNGRSHRYVMAEHVRHDPTYGTSIADALHVDTWGSGHYALEGYEVKTTRSDWRRELPGDGAKSLAWRQHCSRWWIVTVPGVVQGDLPEGWGLILLSPSGLLRRTVLATQRPDPVPLAPRQIAGLMRAVAQTATRHARLTA